MTIVYLNCKLFPFIAWIISGLKTYETRNRNTLKCLVGKTVYLAETGKNKQPIIRRKCIISDPVIVTDRKIYNTYRNKTRIKKGSCYDFNSSTKQKVLYPLLNVQAVKPFHIPDNVIRHGRIYCETI